MNFSRFRILLKRRTNFYLREGKKMLKRHADVLELRKLWSPVAFAFLFVIATKGFIATPVVASDSSTKTNLDGFQLTSGMTLSRGLPSGEGNFGNGSFAEYLEGSCIPFVLSLENVDKDGNTLPITEEIIFDYSATGERFVDLENVSPSSIPSPDEIHNLDQFSYSESSLTAGTVYTSDNIGPLTLSVDGPIFETSPSGEVTGTYSVSVAGVPPSKTVYFTFCARLGENAGSIHGKSTSIRLGSSGQNAAAGSDDLIELPSLTITKSVNGSAAPDQWSFLVTPGLDGVSQTTTLDILDGQSSVTVDNIPVSGPTSFTVTEIQNVPGYTFASGTNVANCVFAASGATATASVAPAADTADLVNASCTFTNEELAQPQLIVIKEVINDNGGVLLPSDFIIDITQEDISTLTTIRGSAFPGESVPLEPGNYSVTELTDPSYAESYSAECSGAIAMGEVRTCTITNDDRPAKLLVQKIVDNTLGGTASVSDFMLTVTGIDGRVEMVDEDGDYIISDAATSSTTFPGSTEGVEILLDAGDYLVSEGLAANYLPSMSSDCAGTIAMGEVRTCMVTNRYTPEIPSMGTLLVSKTMMNDDEGTSSVSDFTFFVTNDFGITAPIEEGARLLIMAGTYTISETGPEGYSATFGGDCATDGTITVLPGTLSTCLITNDDIPPAPAPTTRVSPALNCVMEEDDGTFTAHFGYENTNATSVYIPVGPENSITGGGLSGDDQGQPSIFAIGTTPAYPNSAFSVGFDGTTLTWTLVSDESRSLTADANSPSCIAPEPSQLVVTTVVVNNNGGTMVPSAVTMTVTATNPDPASFPGSDSGVTVDLDPGAYQATGPAMHGYTMTSSADCVGTIVAGETRNCTVTYDDTRPNAEPPDDDEEETGTLIVITQVINDNAGIRLADEFQMHVAGENPLFQIALSASATTIDFAGSEAGVTLTLDPGEYEVTEGNTGGYTVSFSADCTGSLALGETRTCVVTNDDIPEGGSGGSSSGSGGTTQTPPPQVLGETDSTVSEDPAVETEDPIVPPAPAPEVLGATDEELPRTGFPAGLFLFLLPVAAYVARRAS